MAGTEKEQSPDLHITLNDSQSYVVRPAISKTNKQLFLAQSTLPPPPEYASFLKKISRKGLEYSMGTQYQEVNTKPAAGFIRERFELSEKPYVVLSGGGSHEIIERSFWMWLSLSRKVEFDFLGPGFTEPIYFAQRLAQVDKTRLIDVKIITTDLEKGFTGVLNHAEETTEEAENGTTRVWYISHPTTPAGDTTSFQRLKDFIETRTEKGEFVILDEANGDSLPDSESCIPLTEEFSNLLVLRSLSKMVGLPGERIGYAVMSANVGEVYEKVRRVYDMSGHQQLVANEILKPKIIQPHLEKNRAKVLESKKNLIKHLRNRNLKFIPTDERVQYLLVDGETSWFYYVLSNDLSVDVISGAGFSSSHPQLSDRHVRANILPDKKDNGTIARRMDAARSEGYRKRSVRFDVPLESPIYQEESPKIQKTAKRRSAF